MTNRFTSPAIGLLLGMALLLGLAVQPAAAAKKIPTNIRVVTHKGKIIFDGSIKTGTAKIKPNSTCPGLSGRLGPARTLTGATALGQLSQASVAYKALRPVKISDGDYGFGVCGIGGTTAKTGEFWLLRHNFKDAAVGAESLKLKRGDKVLWYLAATWPAPSELFLKAPVKVKKGAKAKVRVFAYDAAGKRSPVAGAKISGAKGALTDAKGNTTLTITRKTKLVARQGDLIPSNRVSVAIRK